MRKFDLVNEATVKALLEHGADFKASVRFAPLGMVYNMECSVDSNLRRYIQFNQEDYIPVDIIMEQDGRYITKGNDYLSELFWLTGRHPESTGKRFFTRVKKGVTIDEAFEIERDMKNKRELAKVLIGGR